MQRWINGRKRLSEDQIWEFTHFAEPRDYEGLVVRLVEREREMREAVRERDVAVQRMEMMVGKRGGGRERGREREGGEREGGERGEVERGEVERIQEQLGVMLKERREIDSRCHEMIEAMTEKDHTIEYLLAKVFFFIFLFI